MEISYLIAGKRFQADDVADLNSKLSEYGLISNLNEKGLGNLSVRRITEEVTSNRYDIVQTYGDPANFENYDVIIGNLISKKGYGDDDVKEVELSELEKSLNEVNEDISDAKILLGSYWS